MHTRRKCDLTLGEPIRRLELSTYFALCLLASSSQHALAHDIGLSTASTLRSSECTRPSQIRLPNRANRADASTDQAGRSRTCSNCDKPIEFERARENRREIA